METPPRKDVSASMIYRRCHETHTACFNRKHQLELEFLNRVRTYCKIRSELETGYAQSLQKLSQQCQISENLANAAGYTNRSLYATFNSYLSESDRIAKQHDDIGRFLGTNVSESLKVLQKIKMDAAKNTFDKLSRIQHELYVSAKEIDQRRREYQSAASTYFESIDKSTKSQKKGLFQKNDQTPNDYGKTSDKHEDLLRALNDKRNLYLLSLAALKEHQKRYFKVDIAALAKDLEQDIYEQIWTYLSSIVLIEKDLYNTAHQQISNMSLQVAECLTPSDHTDTFISSDRQLHESTAIEFDANSRDECRALVLNADSESVLNLEAKKWMSSISRHRRAIHDIEPKLSQMKKLEKHSLTTRTRKSLMSGEAIDDMVESFRESLRKEQTMLAKAEAVVQLLADVGVDLNQLTTYSANESAGINTKSPLLLPTTRRNSQLSLASSTSSDYGTIGKRYIARFDYTAVREDELSLSKGEQLVVIDNSNDVQWPKARNALGMTGVVPTNYIQLATASPLPTIRFAPNENGAGISSIGRDSSNSQAPASMQRPRRILGYCRALIDVDASSDKELQFQFNDLIAITDNRPNLVDDGWWMGYVIPDGRQATFASLAVRMLTSTEAELLIKEMNWSSPKMIVDDRLPMMNGAADDDGAVTMRMPRPPIAKKPPRITSYGGVMMSSDKWTSPTSTSMQRHSSTDNSKHHQVDRF